MYNYTNNQYLNPPDRYSNELRIIQATGDEGMGGKSQSLLLGVFDTKINVSSGIKIDDNLYHSQEAQAPPTSQRKP